VKLGRRCRGDDRADKPEANVIVTSPTAAHQDPLDHPELLELMDNPEHKEVRETKERTLVQEFLQ